MFIDYTYYISSVKCVQILLSFKIKLFVLLLTFKSSFDILGTANV